MADLDEFFKKKDAKKKQKKPVAVKPEKYLEEAVLGDPNDPDEYDSREGLAYERTLEKLGLKNDQEEWKDIGEDDKDYKDLKIKAIRIKDKEEEIIEEKQRQLQLKETDRLNSQASVWSQKPAEESNKDVAPEAEVPEKKEEKQPDSKPSSKPSSRSESPAPPPSSEPKKYVPPHLRNAAGSQRAGDDVQNLAPVSMSSLRTAKTAKGGAPKLDCQEEFPTL